MSWNVILDLRLRRLFLAGEPRWFIADACGVDQKTIANQLKNHRFTKIEREARRERYNKRRAQIEREDWKYVYQGYAVRKEEYRPSEEALAERAQRLSQAPRDLTAALCGDPLPGYSALERRA